MKRLYTHDRYVGNGWKSMFKCQDCGREVWQALNFLGRRKMICNGVKISKIKP